VRHTKKDFEIDWFSGSGAGGQHRNKHQNCCRITHKQTGLRAQSTSHRERWKNQRDAFNRLAGMIIASDDKKERRDSNHIVRTYNYVRGIATDGVIEKPLHPVINGDIMEFIVNSLSGNRPDRFTGRM